MFQPEGKGYPIIDHAATLYRTLFENTGTATVLIEEDMTISLVNSELSRISGLGKEMVENRMKFPDLIAGPDRETVIRNHRHMGRFLHDDLGSHLAGVEALSSLLSSRLSKSDHPDTELAFEIRTLG